MTRIMMRLAAAGMAASLAACALPRSAGALTVFDPLNYEQNLLSALRALEQVNNQVRQLQNQAQMILQMDRQLQSLPGTLAPRLTGTLADIERQVAAGDAIALRVRDTENALERLFPRAFQQAMTGDELVRQTRARWEEEHASFRRAALLQGQITEAVGSDRQVLEEAMERSRSSVGALQAAQAGNELSALGIKQSMQLQTLLASQARAETMGRAREIQGEEEARVRFRSFIGTARAYTPGS